MAELLDKWATTVPSQPALVDERGTTSWHELNERVNRLSNALRGRGLPEGSTIALMCGNRREAFEVTLAAMHSGLVVVPVNWHWAPDELAYVMQDAGASVLFVDDTRLEVAHAASGESTHDGELVVVGPRSNGAIQYEDLVSEGDPAAPASQSSGGPMFYTSGTTGRPKGVRGGLSRTGLPATGFELLAAGIVDTAGIPRQGTTLLVGPMYHSAQWVFSVAPLVSGSTVVMRERFDPAETLELIDAHRCTNVHLVPTQFVRLLRLQPEQKAAFDGSSLSVVLHGAAPCPPEVKRQMLDWWGPVITEYYGGTEGGVLTTITGDQWLQRPGSVGRPTSYADILVYRDDGSEAGCGETGQIYFRSRVGADFRYHNADDKTAAAHRAPGVATLGDIGHLDADGFLYLSDRRIDMIISGGVNIYPAEIESVLATHPAVLDAAVFGVPNEEMGEEVKAAVQLASDAVASDDLAAELVAHVRAHLAGYKAPRTIDFVERLPRDATGKLFKRELRDPFWADIGRRI
ncbi:MAG: AMP-dependent synthetase [Acidimicrobiales bacterium mtb01]|nr:AMP-binding protein [Actinomycetota bacterium]TEX48707.1 MAG: AMP-dependent synthetase [Acidimicrobiales bacterium mtb01]